jgi:hypothetical protein
MVSMTSALSFGFTRVGWVLSWAGVPKWLQPYNGRVDALKSKRGGEKIGLIYRYYTLAPVFYYIDQLLF